MFEDDFPNDLLPHSRLLRLLFLTPGRPTPVVLESIATQVASNKLGRRNHHPPLAVGVDRRFTEVSAIDAVHAPFLAALNVSPTPYVFVCIVPDALLEFLAFQSQSCKSCRRRSCPVIICIVHLLIRIYSPRRLFFLFKLSYFTFLTHEKSFNVT
jgi:hypothetical protein